MKIGRFSATDGAAATGVVIEVDGKSEVLNLTRAAAAFVSSESPVGSLDAMVTGGKALLDKAYELIERSQREGEADWFNPLEGTNWLIPISYSTCLCAGRNFGRHQAEANEVWSARGGLGKQNAIPIGFVKLNSSLVAHGASVPRPREVETLDYEIEIAAIIGRRIDWVAETEALDAVFGYTIFNDLSAREWQYKEMESRLLLIGKNFPGAGPIGPWILTADEMPNPQTFELELRVNGERRQAGTCEDMIFSFAELISFWSRAGLNPGSAITSGTPEGVASSHKPDPKEWYLKPGDIVEAKSRQIGTLTTKII